MKKNKKNVLLFLLCGVLLSSSISAQEVFYIGNPSNIHLGNSLAITLGGGAIVAKDTLAFDDTLYTRGGQLRGYYKLKRLVVDGGGSVSAVSATGSSDTTEIMITGGLFVTGGSTFNADSQLTIISTAAATGRVEQLTTGNSVSGKLTLQRFVPGGRRAYRFLSHPFTTAQVISSQIMDDVDVTGVGGSANGFTNTQTNNPSAWFFDAPIGDTNVFTTNPGWTAFPNANTANWLRYQCIYMLVRGAIGEGLQGQAYTPSATTIDVNGLINQGNQVVNLVTGVNGAGYNYVGNPYPSHINLKDPLNAVVNKRGTAYWVMNTNLGTRGGYEPVLYGADYWLPSNSGFAIDVSANTSITFQESYKVDTGRALFKGTGISDLITLEVYSDTQKSFWDKMYVMFDNSAVNKYDNYDAVKHFNGEVDMYAITTDASSVSVDGRPFVDNEIVPINFDTKLQKHFEIHVSDYSVQKGNIVYLYDKYLKTTTKLQAGTVYAFDVTSDSLSAGARFQLGLSAVGVASISTDDKIKIYPNPTQDVLNIQMTEPLTESALLVITDATGKSVLGKEVKRNTNSIKLSVASLPAGMYSISIRSASGNKMDSKFIKLAK